MSYTTIAELQIYGLIELAQLAHNLRVALPDKRGRRVVTDEYNAYGLWPSQYVRRRYIEIYKVQGWKNIPMEKHKPPPSSQKKLF